MILPFSTQLNGKPTYFVEKIWKSLKINDLTLKSSLEQYDRQYFEIFGNTYFDYKKNVKQKLHTIREDKNNRWKAGVIIDFFINARTKEMFRFAPRIPVVSTQKIEIIHCSYDGEKYNMDKGVWIRIDDIVISDFLVNELAQNDGFDTVEEFFKYFNTDFSGIIIHWTNFRY